MMPTFYRTLLEYLEQDDEYMYFEVFQLDEEKLSYESRGVVYMRKAEKDG